MKSLTGKESLLEFNGVFDHPMDNGDINRQPEDSGKRYTNVQSPYKGIFFLPCRHSLIFRSVGAHPILTAEPCLPRCQR